MVEDKPMSNNELFYLLERNSGNVTIKMYYVYHSISKTSKYFGSVLVVIVLVTTRITYSS